MKRTLSLDSLRDAQLRLERAQETFGHRYPGNSGERQPVHVVYGGAHLFRAGIASRFSELSLRSLDEFAPDCVVFAKALGLLGAERLPDSPGEVSRLVQSLQAHPAGAARNDRAGWFAFTIYNRVREKLRREPVEDFRIDFEDGYGIRPDREEDEHAGSAAHELANGITSGVLPPFIGIRVKPLSRDMLARSVRTLDIFVTQLASQTRGKLPPLFRITLPKVTVPEEVAFLGDLCARLEGSLSLRPGALRIELMIETPQAIINSLGQVNLLPLVDAAAGRCLGLHFGPYDYVASRNIASVHNAVGHFASDFAREIMQVALAKTGAWLADGPTNLMPIGPHRSTADVPLSVAQQQENRHAVHRAWKLHFDNVRKSLHNGFDQGWDLHPAQLPARYAAVYSFFLENLDTASERMRNFLEKAAQATRLGQIFDDAAMAQGLLNYFARAANCGAITASEVESLTTVSVAELRAGSFLKILDARRG